jgi:PAS domain S-box-containing protein
MSFTTELASRLSTVLTVQQEILNVVDDPDRVMQVLVQQAPEVTGADGAVILAIEGDELVYVSASGPAAEHVGLRLPIDRTLAGTAIREKTLVRCDDTELDFRVDVATCRKVGIRSMIVVPTVEGGEATGVLMTFAGEPGRFSDLDSYLLQLLAGSASSALMQARATRACIISEQRLRMLFDRNLAGVFWSDADGRLLDCNDSLVRTFGYDSREEMMSHPSWDFYQQRSDRVALLDRLEKEHALAYSRIPLKKRDGSPFTAIMSVSLVPAAEGADQLLGILIEDHAPSPAAGQD